MFFSRFKNKLDNAYQFFDDRIEEISNIQDLGVVAN